MSEFVSLVDEAEVACVPDQDEDVGDVRLDDSSCQSCSGSLAVQSEPSNEEADSGESWGEQEHINEWVPPWQGNVHELEVGGKELLEGNSPADKSNNHNTGLNWQAAEAGLSSSVLVTALANAAAQLRSNWLSLLCSIGSLWGIEAESSTGGEST